MSIRLTMFRCAKTEIWVCKVLENEEGRSSGDPGPLERGVYSLAFSSCFRYLLLLGYFGDVFGTDMRPPQRFSHSRIALKHFISLSTFFSLTFALFLVSFDLQAKFSATWAAHMR